MIRADLTPLTPKFIRADRNGRALMKAMEAGLNYFLTRIGSGLKTVTDIDEMPEWRLDEMAWEMSVTWYDSGAGVEEKRQTIRDAQAVYDTLGTPQAVLRAVQGVYNSGRISEWFDWGGNAFSFRVYVTDEDAMDAKREQFIKMISTVKPAGAILDNIYYVGAEGTATAWTETAATGLAGEASATAR